MEILLFLLGSVTVRADYASATELLNLCMYQGITFSDLNTFCDYVTVRFRLSQYKRFCRAASERDIEYCEVKRGGLPEILSRYRSRWGIVAGMLCAIAITVLSHSFVWAVEVEGNASVTTEEIISLLEDQGFSVGSPISQANTDRIENKIMIESDKISWMSINIIGTVAHVQIREYGSKPNEESTKKPANLIAKKAGLVEEVRLFRGNAVVSAGKYVEKGELLVSGLFDSNQIGFRYTRAAGAVMARTEEEIYVEIPLEYESREYTGEEYCEKYVNFFDFSVNISKNYGKMGALYDKIDIVENYDLFGVIKTPISVRTVKYMEYETVTKTRTAEEAEALAYFRLSELLAEMAEDGMIISKRITPIIKNDGFAIYCTVVSIENIAEVSEFEVELSE